MKLQINQPQTIKIHAWDYYSRISLSVKKGEVYSFSVAKRPIWVDFFVPCNADGFHNPILADRYKRLRGAKCFKLCGNFNKKEETNFAIGQELENYTIPEDGELYFFANDHRARFFYLNNWGRISLTINRIQ